MKRLFQSLSLFLVSALAAHTCVEAAAAADPLPLRRVHAVAHVRPDRTLVTRTGADRYFDHRAGAEVRTVGCTVTANLMSARVVPDPMRRPGVRFLVFLDRDGREEGECELLPVARKGR